MKQKYSHIKVGAKLYWNDPARETSGWVIVTGVPDGFYEEPYDDAIIDVRRPYEKVGGTEVYPCELSIRKR